MAGSTNNIAQKTKPKFSRISALVANGATTLLDDLGLRVSIYNHQLCTIDRRLWPLAVPSISDWKNEYLEECVRCAERERCGGFFATGRSRRSSHIKAVTGDGP